MNTVNYGHYPIAGDRLWDRFRKKHWNAVDLFLQKGLTCDECGKEIIPQWWALRLATASSMLGSMIAQIISAWLIRTLGCNILIAIIIAIAAMLLFDQLFPALIAAGIPWVENSDANVRSKLAHERFTKVFNKTAFMLLKSIMFIAACNLWLWN